MNKGFFDSVIEHWKNIQDSDEEQKLFKAYLKKREEFFRLARQSHGGNVRTEEVQRASCAEGEAFHAYLEHRLGHKGE